MSTPLIPPSSVVYAQVYVHTPLIPIPSSVVYTQIYVYTPLIPTYVVYTLLCISGLHSALYPYTTDSLLSRLHSTARASHQHPTTPGYHRFAPPPPPAPFTSISPCPLLPSLGELLLGHGRLAAVCFS